MTAQTLTGRRMASLPAVQNIPGSLAHKISWALERGQARTAATMLASACLSVGDFEQFQRFAQDAVSLKDADLSDFAAKIDWNLMHAEERAQAASTVTPREWTLEDHRKRWIGQRVVWTDYSGDTITGDIIDVIQHPHFGFLGRLRQDPLLYRQIVSASPSFLPPIDVPVEALARENPWQIIYQYTAGPRTDDTDKKYIAYLEAYNAALIQRDLYAEVVTTMERRAGGPHALFDYTISVRYHK